MKIEWKSFQGAKEQLTFAFFVEIIQTNLFVLSTSLFLFDNGRAKAQDTHDRGTNLFSDGAAQHFKQSLFFNLVTFLPKLLGVEDLKIIYDFFATSHGKGAVDGIGGSAKRGGNKLPLPIFHISQPPHPQVS